ncbi:hypothetical protein ABZ769_35370 [Streptomyces olivoreticuli]
MATFEERMQEEADAIYAGICRGEVEDAEAALMDAHLRLSDDDSR